MNRATTLLVTAALCAAAVPVHAALNAYIKVTGSKQGTFKGAGKSKSHWIPTVSFTYDVIAPRDAASGLATGKRQHKPFLFTVSESDAPEFITALAGKEVLSSVTVNCTRDSSPGKVEQYLTIDLKNASVGTIRKVAGPKGGPAWVEEVQLTYQQINETRTNGKITAADDWTQ